MRRFLLVIVAALYVAVPARAVTCALFNSTQFANASGQPLSGGLVYTTVAGSATPATAYTSATCATPAANPVVMNAGGFVQLFLDVATNYRLTIRNSAGVLIQTLDGVQMGAGGGGGGTSQWTTAGSAIYNANAGNVGIGTAAPLEKLAVVGNFDLQGGLKLRNSASTSYVVQHLAPLGMSADYSLTWPTALPGAPSCPQFTVSGVGSWTTCSGGGGGGSGAANYTQTFTAVTSATLTHNLNSTAVLIACYDNGTPELLIALTATYPKLTDANNADVAWTGSKTGHCVVNSSAGNPNLWSRDADSNITLTDSATAVSTLKIKNQTASTGISNLLLVAGAGQIGSTANLLTIRSNAGVDLAAFDYRGSFVTRNLIITDDGSGVGCSMSGSLFNGLTCSNSKSLAWSGTTLWFDPLDTGIARNSAGVVEINNGTPGTLRDLTLRNLTVSGTCTGCGGGGGGSLPVVDTTSIVEGSVDSTKQLRFEVDGFTTSTTRVLTPQNNSYTISGTDIAQTVSGVNTFSAANNFTNTNVFSTAQTMRDINPQSDDTYRLGVANRFFEVNGNRINGVSTGGTSATNYINTRKVNILDSSGQTGFWDQQTSVISGLSSSWFLRDSGGVNRLTMEAVSGGSSVNRAILNFNFLPSLDNTWSLGNGGFRWSSVNAQTGSFQSLITTGGGSVVLTAPSVFLGGASSSVGIGGSGASVSFAGVSSVTTPIGTAGLDTSLACPSGQAIKAMLISKGFVTAAACGAP